MQPAQQGFWRGLWSGTKRFANWMRRDMAEWVVGTWALLIGWIVFSTIFFNFLLMDGHFSRGLGEGSGVNPDRFQQVGWMYRLFAAAFLMLGTKLALMGLKKHALAVRVIGCFITIIVVLHATGFGLKALEGKRSTAIAVEAVANETTASNESKIATLESRQDKIRADLKLAVDPLKTRMAGLDKDGKFNEERTDALQARVAALENAAQAKIDKIDDEILAATVSGGEAKVENAEALAKNEKWAPLFVGLAQVFTWNPEPTDWAIYVCAVLFIIFWVLVGDSIAITLPDALYAIHLADAKNKPPKDVRVDPDVFKDLQAQSDELKKRKANLSDGAARAQTTKKKKENRALSKNLLQDHRAEEVKKEDAERQKVEVAIQEMNANYVDEDETEPPEAGEEPEIEEQSEQQDELQLTEEVIEDSADADGAEDNDNDSDEGEQGAEGEDEAPRGVAA